MKIMLRPCLVMTSILVTAQICAQDRAGSQTIQVFDLAATVGQSQGSGALSWTCNWKIGRKRRLEWGGGIRWTTYGGTKKEFITAGPARLTRSFTFPFLIVFAGQEEARFDTLTVQRPLTNSLNLMVDVGYNISSRWYAGFNIDVIGFSFGRKSSAVFQGNEEVGGPGMYTEPAAKPAGFNLLLTGDHDRGSLNSEFFVRYRISRNWTLRAIYQFLFIEYTSSKVRQRFDTGEINSRFRNKANNLGLGVSYLF